MDINFIKDLPDKSQETLRKVSAVVSERTTSFKNKSSVVYNALDKDIKKSLVGLRSNVVNRFNESFQKRKKTWKVGMILGGTVIALGFARSLWNHSFFNRSSPVIPEYYRRGYDNINERLTDFGSPVNLAKTASKTITPYHSSVRRGVRTTTAAITQTNQSLYNHRNAIGHTRY